MVGDRRREEKGKQFSADDFICTIEMKFMRFSWAPIHPGPRAEGSSRMLLMVMAHCRSAVADWLLPVITRGHRTPQLAGKPDFGNHLIDCFSPLMKVIYNKFYALPELFTMFS